MKAPPETLRWEGDLDGRVVLIDQTRLPTEEVLLPIETVAEMVDAIRRLAVRGAPAIGVAAAYGVLLDARRHAGADGEDAVARVRESAAILARSRPTAVNLFWALDRMVARAQELLAAGTPGGTGATGATGTAVLEGLLAEARAIHAEDADTCRRIGEHGAELLGDEASVLTHCNAGALATGGMGTALAPVYVATERGKRLRVLADETRPLLQGRLTAWELDRAGIDVTLITDGMAASAMRRGDVDAVIVGADRIARNGDVCNKIGTYAVALAAQKHGIPFYVAAPLSTFDPELDSGADIPIEERAPEEVTLPIGGRETPAGASVWNPAFDVTPADMITAIVTEVGLIEGPDEAKVVAALREGGRLPA